MVGHYVGWEVVFAVWTGDFAVGAIFEVSIQLGHGLLVAAQMAREAFRTLLLLLLALHGLWFAAFEFLLSFALQLSFFGLLLGILFPAHGLGCALGLVDIEVGGGNSCLAGGTGGG